MRLLLTRPLPDAAPLAKTLRAQGHEVVLCPLMRIRREPSATLDTTGVQALVLTSANGARALAERLQAAPELAALPAFAVGAATAAAARDAGLAQVESADGDVETLARLLAARLDPRNGALLHVAGRRVAGDLAGVLAGKGFQVRRTVLYDAVTAATFPDNGLAVLNTGEIDAVLFYSPRSAATFVRLLKATGAADACRAVEALVLSPAVAEALRGLAWRRIRIARRPEQAALLALLDDGDET